MREPPYQDHRPVGPVDASQHEFQIALTQAIQEASPEGILVVDDRGRIVSHNRRLLEVWSIRSEELPGAPAGSVVGIPDHHLLSRVIERVKDPRDFVARVDELYANPRMDDHCELELNDGRTLERHSTGLWGNQDRYLGRVWFFRDITSGKLTEAALRASAQTDPLTGVANRRQFYLRANAEFDRARRFSRQLSFVMMDIDRFKDINDRWGHAVGDDVLRTLCGAWQRVVRQADVLARIGGEEFALLLAETDLERAHLVAEKLRQLAAGQRVTAEAEEVRFTISAGVSTLKPADHTIDETIERADRALYRAKENGRNRTEDGN